MTLPGRFILRSNSWKKLDGVDVSAAYPSTCEVNLNEFCHWLGFQCDMVSFDFRNEIFSATTLVSFDFSKERSFERTPSISDKKWERLNRRLVVLNGYVAFICTVLLTAYCHIWFLGELGVKE